MSPALLVASLAYRRTTVACRGRQQHTVQLDIANRVTLPLWTPCTKSCATSSIAGFQAAAVATASGVVCAVDLRLALQNTEESGAILRRWEPSPFARDCIGRLCNSGFSALAAVPAVNALVATWRPDLWAERADASWPPLGALRVLDVRQEAPTTVLDPPDGGCPEVVQLFSPPGCSRPTVLAAITTGEIVLVDLRMLGSKQVWPIVVAASAGGGGGPRYTVANQASLRSGGRHGLAHGLAGGRRGLLVARGDGALLSVFGSTGATSGGGGGGGGVAGGDEDWEKAEAQRQAKKEESKRKKAEKKQAKVVGKDAGRRQSKGRQGKGSKGSR